MCCAARCTRDISAGTGVAIKERAIAMSIHHGCSFCLICAGAKAGERRNLKAFLEVFGEAKVATVVLAIAAFIFLFKIYKAVAAYFREKYRLEMEKEKQMQGILKQVEMYPKWREQSIERQKEFTKAINALRGN